MLWNDVIKLITVACSANGLGDNTGTKTERQVFADKKDVTRSEFYQAMANGLKPAAVFEMSAIDYEGEKKLSHEGEEYNIIRTFSKDGEKLELICDRTISDIPIYLTNLVVTTATLSPAFAGTTYAYTASVANAVSSVTVTPTCATATEITVNSLPVASGVASSAVALAVGANTITVVMRKTAKPTRTYTITITRAVA